MVLCECISLSGTVVEIKYSNSLVAIEPAGELGVPYLLLWLDSIKVNLSSESRTKYHLKSF